MLPDDTLAAVLGRYDDVARRTEDLVRSLDSLDVTHPLPEAAVVPTGTRWSARQVLLHILARPPSTPVMPTSSARPSMVRKPWGEGSDDQLTETASMKSTIERANAGSLTALR